jgi:hypothetical protein
MHSVEEIVCLMKSELVETVKTRCKVNPFECITYLIVEYSFQNHKTMYCHRHNSKFDMIDRERIGKSTMHRSMFTFVQYQSIKLHVHDEEIVMQIKKHFRCTYFQCILDKVSSLIQIKDRFDLKRIYLCN